MSKGANRNKKTPMFVSNINSNYDFVDYTEPGQTPPSAFGNPNPNSLTVGPTSNQSPKKQQNNWFEQMLDTQQTTNLSPSKANTNYRAEETKANPVDTYDTGFSYSYSQNSTFTTNVRS